MSDNAQLAENICMITDAGSSVDSVARGRPATANPGKSPYVAALARNPHLTPEAATVPVISPGPPKATTGAMPVLIVDDVAMNREIASSILRAAGHQVICVECGAEAIAAVGMTEFGVILMDVRMPLMDGLETTRRIRALPGGRGFVPIVALTGQDFPEQIEACRNAGMNGHVSKPFDPDKLVAAVVRATSIGPARSNPNEPAFMTVCAPDQKARRTGSELRVIDLETFKRTAAFLAPKAVAAYLRKIAALASALLVMLDGPEVPEWSENEFAGAAHVVAGTAGMFGFERVTVLSRQFEHATECGMPDAPPLAEALSAAIKETLPEIRSRMMAPDA